MANRQTSAGGIVLALILGTLNCRGADPVNQQAPNPSFFGSLVIQARDSAKQGYKDPKTDLPDYLKNLSYDDYHRIVFRRDKSIWHGQPGMFQLQFFHRGYIYRDAVRIHILDGEQDREVAFSPDMFEYGPLKFPEPLSTKLSFAGFRILYPLNQPAKMDELSAFLGSSFFRILGAGQYFGISARGLAIDTAEKSGEEFPRFTEFWIRKPGPVAGHILIYARLESPRVAGAYQFTIKPGAETVVEVDCHIFLRADVKKLGIAPLTTMFFYGESRTQYHSDFRPEVHDSDGLLLHLSDNSWDWRALVNPPKIHQVTAFPGPTGYGLMQRDRNGDHYQDLEARFENRPSYWVAPKGDWGRGQVELVEIPSNEERNDNMVAYWTPSTLPHPGQDLHFEYQLRSLLSNPELPAANLLRVQGTRLQPGKDGRARFIVDFAGGDLPQAEMARLEARVETSSGKLENIISEPNPLIDGWRVFFDVSTEGKNQTELKCHLEQNNKPVSENWVYQYVLP